MISVCERVGSSRIFPLLGPALFRKIMRLKNPNQVPVGGFTFFYKASSGRVSEVSANSLPQLTEKVRLTFLAQSISYTGELSDIIQHQICLNQPAPADCCDSSGLGDDLHVKFVAPFLRAVGKAIEDSGISTIQSIGRMAIQASNCEDCGGSKVYDPEINNQGRAGNLNSIFPK